MIEPLSGSAKSAEIQFHRDKRFSSQKIGEAKIAKVVTKNNKHSISIVLKRPARELLAQLTNKHQGEWIYLRIKEKVLFSGVLPEPILDGEFQVSGEFDKQEADDIVATILGP